MPLHKRNLTGLEGASQLYRRRTNRQARKVEAHFLSRSEKISSTISKLKRIKTKEQRQSESRGKGSAHAKSIRSCENQENVDG
jgi:hypothetical protein